MKDEILKIDPKPNQYIDMPTLTYVVYSLFDDKNIVYNTPVHSKFKKYQYCRNDVWFIHK